MDVTRDNFESLLPLIRHSISSADFIAFDTEFSGTYVLFHFFLPSFFRAFGRIRRQGPRLRHGGGPIPEADSQLRAHEHVPGGAVHFQVESGEDEVCVPALQLLRVPRLGTLRGPGSPVQGNSNFAHAYYIGYLH